MTKILAMAGRKQSGKSSAGKYIIGNVLKSKGIVEDFGMAVEDGELYIYEDGKPNLVVSPDAFPLVRIYHLGDMLKEVVINVFGVNREYCYGSDEDKNKETDIKWNDIRFMLAPMIVKRLKDDNMLNDNLTIRQFLQYFGTDVCRRIMNDCWVKACLKQINDDGAQLAIICDCRFPDEVENIQAAGGKVIYLTRNVKNDSHSSETALDGFTGFDAIVDNQDNMTLIDKNFKVLDILHDWKWLPLEEINDSNLSS